MNCQEIQKLLKHFQADMLPDGQYQEYVAHLNECAKCREYISRFGFLSNQVWALGQIDPPSDLASTIFFRLQHPQRKRRVPQWHLVRIVPKNFLWAASLSLLAAAGFVVGSFQSRPPTGGEKTTVISDQFAAQQSFKEPAPSREKEDIAAPAGKSTVELYAYMEGPPPPGAKTPYHFLHWHLDLLPQRGEADPAALRRLEQEVRLNSARLDKIELEIQRLKGLSQESFKQHYSPDSQAADVQEAQTRARKLAAVVQEKEKTLADIAGLKSEQERLKQMVTEEAAYRRHRKEECRAHLINAVSLWRISPDYNADDAVVFSAKGAKVEQILKEILLADQKKYIFKDFTEDILIDPKGMYRVFVSLMPTETNTRHWHMESPHAVERSAMENMILRFGGRLKYDTKKNLVFVIPGTSLDEFEKSLKAKRFTYIEYGAGNESGDILMSKPVTISVFFTD